VFIPFGTILLLPGDTLHGGGFYTSEISHNQRLHFVPPPDATNVYCDHGKGQDLSLFFTLTVRRSMES